jgi:hypothetical protein
MFNIWKKSEASERISMVVLALCAVVLLGLLIRFVA